jgi:hypothetical protein
MKRCIALVVLAVLFTFASVGAAMADELQFGGGVISFTGVSGGVNLSVSPFIVQLSNPTGDTAVGSIVNFGTVQPLAFFATTTGSSVLGSVNTPPTQTFSITGAGGTLTGDIQAITLSSNNPGVFALSVTVSPVTLSSGASSLVLNSIYNNSGAATISFQFSNDNFQTVNGITSLAVESTQAATASGSIAAVPEPASMMMLGSGLLAIVSFKNRRKR